VTGALFARGVRGGILIGLAFTTALAIAAGLARPTGVLSLPPSLAPTLLQMDLGAAWRHVDLILVFLIMLVFDTVGTLIGVSEQAGLTVDGRLPRADRAMLADALGTLAGAALGTSTVSSYIESATGVAEGARTGLANVMTATLFLAALFLAPLVAMVGGGVSLGGLPITAPVVILVGSLMIGPAARIAWSDPTEAIPAFVTLTLIPFTFNIAHGLAGGIVFYVLVKAGAGRRREVSWLMWVLAAVLVTGYALLPRLRH
jgi:AGZA family xanthine/uracil permease-like MFS transporter